MTKKVKACKECAGDHAIKNRILVCGCQCHWIISGREGVFQQCYITTKKDNFDYLAVGQD